jgi:hypothetical protein
MQYSDGSGSISERRVKSNDRGSGGGGGGVHISTHKKQTEKNSSPTTRYIPRRFYISPGTRIIPRPPPPTHPPCPPYCHHPIGHRRAGGGHARMARNRSVRLCFVIHGWMEGAKAWLCSVGWAGRDCFCELSGRDDRRWTWQCWLDGGREDVSNGCQPVFRGRMAFSPGLVHTYGCSSLL